MTKPLDRRDILKIEAAALAAAAGGIACPRWPLTFSPSARTRELKWNKAPCRFCGTGCSVSVAMQDNRVVATHGDPEAEVNRGLNCVKGYFLSKIMYGADRLTQPLLRKKDGQFAKNGDFVPVSWDEAFDVMAAQVQGVLKAKGRTGIGMVGSGPMDDLGRLCRQQADEGGLPLQPYRSQCAALHGIGGHRLHAHLRHGRADGLL